MAEDLRLVVAEPVALRIDPPPKQASGIADRWIAPIFSLVAVIVGGMITYYSTQHTAQASKTLDMQTTAYTDFANSQSEFMALNGRRDYLTSILAKAPDGDRSKLQEEIGKVDQLIAEVNLRIRASTNKISIYGEPDVVHAIAQFYRKLRSDRPTCDANNQFDRAIYENVRAAILRDEPPADVKSDMAMNIYLCESASQGTSAPPAQR